jgi:hypothetical protein
VSEAAATFWNQRFRDHSACWGEARSPTLQVALKYFPATGRVLEIGYGYGRDRVAVGHRGLAITGIDPSEEGQHMAEARPAGSPAGWRPWPGRAPSCASARATCATSIPRA